MNDFWKQQYRVDRLVELNEQGLSASQLARGIGEGCTRNMCIGKLRRLGIPLMGKTNGGENERVRSYTRRPSPPKPRLVIPPPSKEPIIFLCPPETLPEMGVCRFIQGDILQGGWQVCGNKVAKPGTSWCKDHWHIVYAPQQTAASRQKSEAIDAARSAKQDAQMRRVGMG